MRTITRDIVGAFVFSSDGRVLFGLHDPKGGGAYAGFWVVPGGGIDEGETGMQAVYRESMEEAGLDLSPYMVKLVDNSDSDTQEKMLRETGERVVVSMRFHNYKVETGKPAAEVPMKPGDEPVQLKWFDIAELPNAKLPSITRGVFKRWGYIK